MQNSWVNEPLFKTQFVSSSLATVIFIGTLLLNGPKVKIPVALVVWGVLPWSSLIVIEVAEPKSVKSTSTKNWGPLAQSLTML